MYQVLGTEWWTREHGPTTLKDFIIDGGDRQVITKQCDEQGARVGDAGGKG